MSFSKYELNHGFIATVIWQESEENVPEPALVIRNYSDGMIEIRQGKKDILITADAIEEVIKVLKDYKKL